MRVIWEKVGSENVFETTVFDYWNGKSTKSLLNKFDENEKKNYNGKKVHHFKWTLAHFYFHLMLLFFFTFLSTQLNKIY